MDEGGGSSPPPSPSPAPQKRTTAPPLKPRAKAGGGPPPLVKKASSAPPPLGKMKSPPNPTALLAALADPSHRAALTAPPVSPGGLATAPADDCSEPDLADAMRDAFIQVAGLTGLDVAAIVDAETRTWVDLAARVADWRDLPHEDMRALAGDTLALRGRLADAGLWTAGVSVQLGEFHATGDALDACCTVVGSVAALEASATRLRAMVTAAAADADQPRTDLSGRLQSALAAATADVNEAERGREMGKKMTLVVRQPSEPRNRAARRRHCRAAVLQDHPHQDRLPRRRSPSTGSFRQSATRPRQLPLSDRQPSTPPTPPIASCFPLSIYVRRSTHRYFTRPRPRARHVRCTLQSLGREDIREGHTHTQLQRSPDRCA